MFMRDSPGVIAFSCDARLPVRVAIMFLDKDFDGWKRIVIDFATQPRGRPFYDDVLVDFVIATVRFRIGQLFVAAARVPETCRRA